MSEPWSLDGIPEVVCLVGPVQAYRNAIHDDYKLFVVDGSGYTVTRRGVAHHAEPGELFVLHPGSAHSGAPDDGYGQWRIICVPAPAVAEVAGPVPPRFEPPLLRDDRLGRRFRDVFALFAEPAPALECESGLYELLALLTERRSRPGEPDEPSSATHRRISLVVHDYLSANLTRNVNLDELARAAGVSKFAIARACSAHYGLPPHALQLRLRLDRACELIRDGLPLGEIGVRTGFHDQAHFTRQFVQAYGETPTEMRQSWHGDGPRRKIVHRAGDRESSSRAS